MRGRSKKIENMIIIAMFTAVLSVLSMLQIPMPSGVPITLQTFAVALCGYVQGWKKGTASVLLYLLVGLTGIPVFAGGMRGGIGVLLGPTGGFLLGFIGMSVMCGLGAAAGDKKLIRYGSGIAGLGICHLAGVLQFALVTGRGVGESFLLVSIPYLVKDVISAAGACAAAIIIKRVMIRQGIVK